MAQLVDTLLDLLSGLHTDGEMNKKSTKVRDLQTPSNRLHKLVYPVFMAAQVVLWGLRLVRSLTQLYNSDLMEVD
jgi:hypothetical protein